jgi:hypothetical protein
MRSLRSRSRPSKLRHPCSTLSEPGDSLIRAMWKARYGHADQMGFDARSVEGSGSLGTVQRQKGRLDQVLPD